VNPRIYLLAFGTFTVGTEGYVVAGVLPAVARDMHTSVALCGQLVTIFALVYAVAGPPLIGMSTAIPPKRLLVGAALLFAVANLLAAVAPDYLVLAGARVLAAMGAALFMAPAAAAAAALCRPEQLPHAIAVTASGNALALTLGAPIGTLIGSAFGWRGAFGFVTLLGVISAVGVAAILPEVPVPAVVTGRLKLLRSSSFRVALLTSFGIFLAAYCTYTYLSPVVGRATGMGSTGVAALMIVFGAGGFLAGRTIGRILARYAIPVVQRSALVAMGVIMALVAALTAVHLPDLARFAMFPLMFLFGLAWWGAGVSQQTRIATHAPQQRAVALGMHFSAQFLGVAVGGAVGGVALSVGGPMLVPIVSVLVAFAAIASVRAVVPIGFDATEPLPISAAANVVATPVCSTPPTARSC